jgi:membrane protein implicated in regulation of membrane protease activity
MSTKLRFGKRSITLPGNPAVRMVLGILLIVCGLVGFLPILGFWMVPLGLLILSVDIAAVRRFRRRMEVKWGRWRQRRRAAKALERGEA